MSAEHCIGIEKEPYPSMRRRETELATMRLLERALDPKGLLGPEKTFDTEALLG